MSAGLKYDPYGFVLGSPPVLPPKGTPIPRRVLARNASYTLLLNQLIGYGRGEIAGRSFLIAGPRGSGKTTLVREVCREAALTEDGYRVIEVRVHGPSLFKPPCPRPTAEDPHPEPVSVDEHVLKTLVINLYQTAAEEVETAFRQHVEKKGDEALELAAQLRLTLDGAPSAAALRFFWERAGAWPRGVLFPELPETHQLWRPDQAAAEIVALSTASDAYRRCTGELRRQSVDEQSAGLKETAEAKVSAGGKEMAQALMSVITGVAAGAAAAATGTKPAVSALAGAVTALVSNLAVSYQRTNTRETAVREAITFLPDTRASALVHRVLLLLRRFRQAGFAPVFLIDELDKVDNLVEPLNRLTRSLKFLFADEAFFCFLADRRYFLQFSQITRDRSNPVEKTIFSHQLFIRYEPQDLKRYLAQVIRPHGAEDSKSFAELEADAEALRYILIQRSRLLMFELSRAVADFTGEEFWLKVESEEPRKELVHQFHLMMQLAIELVLSEKVVANRVERDPDFAAALCDGLYFPTWCWYKDSSALMKCTPDQLIEGIEEMTGEAMQLTPPDQRFLHAQVKRLLHLLANPSDLEAGLRAADTSGRLKVPAPVRQAVPVGISLLAATPDNEYAWIYNRYGVHRQASDITAILDTRDLWIGIDMLDTLPLILGDVLGRRISPADLLASIADAEHLIDQVSGIIL